MMAFVFLVFMSINKAKGSSLESVLTVEEHQEMASST